jgi:hypothetical protein
MACSQQEPRALPSGLAGFKSRHNLAVVLTKMGDLAGAAHRWRELIREEPGPSPVSAKKGDSA